MESQPRPSVAWPIVFAIVAVIVVLTAAGLFIFQSVRAIPGDVVEGGLKVAGRLRELAGAFREGTVETSFFSYATRVSGSNFLQIASLQQTEVYTRQDKTSVLWGQLALPEVVVAATAPVEYTYYVDLDETWEFRLQDQVLWVDAPSIRFNTPAIDVSELHFEVRTSSLLRDEAAVIEQLRVGLTELSKQRAAEHVDLIRETARRRTEVFVRTWLAGTFEDAARYRVEVTFDDELIETEADKPRRRG
ncbi:MAG: hypothetical protein OEM62_00845 [Acidobacteriota bacterium]|nr:hypothetical protein [Acidobacteriota bacterium]